VLGLYNVNNKKNGDFGEGFFFSKRPKKEKETVTNDDLYIAQVAVVRKNGKQVFLYYKTAV
jgi:hypothetical protein